MNKSPVSIETLPAAQRPPVSDLVDHAIVEWRRFPLRLHLLAVAVLALLTVVRYAELLVHPAAWIDESIYEEGFEALLAGDSPYSLSPPGDGFYYPPPFAHAGAFLLARLGGPALRGLVRAASVLSVAWVVWLAAAWLPHPRDQAAAHGDAARGYALRLFAAALLVVSPIGIELGFRVGNFSFIIAALLMTAVVLYPWRPILGGFLLGVSLVLKPLAPAVAAVLFAQRPGRKAARAGRITAVVAGLTASLLVAPFLPELQEMLSQRLSTLVRGRILSTYRIAELVGIPLDRAFVFALLTLVLMALSWRFGRSHGAVVALALGGVVVTAPALWGHTMVIFFPVLVIATVHAYRNWSALRAAATGSLQDRAAAAEMSLVAVALVATLFFQSGGFDHLAGAIQIGFLVPLLVIPLFLVGYVLWASSRPSSAP